MVVEWAQRRPGLESVTAQMLSRPLEPIPQHVMATNNTATIIH